MANTFNMQETWNKVYQITHHKIPVYPAISSFRLAADLKKGDTAYRTYRSSLVANDLGSEGSYTRQDVTDSDESLAIDKEKETTFYVKELDEIQSHLPIRSKYAYDATAAIFNQIDGDVLGDYDQYTNNLDDGDLGGTAGNGITVTSSNVRQLFTTSNKLLQRNNIKLDNGARFTGFRKPDSSSQRGVAVISPDVYQNILETLDGKESALGDKVAINGHAGRYMGFDLFISNATGWSGVLALATLPTATDTVVINGVTFTFVATIGTTAGNVLRGANAAAANTNLAALINTPGTTTAQGVALSAANQNLMKNITATAGATSTTLKATGKGYVVVSETLTDATDTWTAATQIQHCLIGVNDCIDLVIQKQPGMLVKDRDGYIGKDIVTWTAYGKKVFNDQTSKCIDVRVRSDAY